MHMLNDHKSKAYRRMKVVTLTVNFFLYFVNNLWSKYKAMLLFVPFGPCYP